MKPRNAKKLRKENNGKPQVLFLQAAAHTMATQVNPVPRASDSGDDQVNSRAAARHAFGMRGRGMAGAHVRITDHGSEASACGGLSKKQITHQSFQRRELGSQQLREASNSAKLMRSCSWQDLR